jgi:hypothetical protein
MYDDWVRQTPSTCAVVSESALVLCGTGIELVQSGSHPSFVLGAAIEATCFGLSPSGGLIAAGFREGRIRISRFPAAYDIVAFCLEHVEAVTALVWMGDEAFFAVDGAGFCIKWGVDGAKLAGTRVSEAPLEHLAVAGGSVFVAEQRVVILDGETLERKAMVEVGAPIFGLAGFCGRAVALTARGLSFVGSPESLLERAVRIDVPKARPVDQLKRIIRPGMEGTEEVAVWRDPGRGMRDEGG